ncbi:MAG: hypothetical protein HY366_02460, partial [Candidatus Aenigmarchaeota archaeon]|nr:hypothetical protein [Candidatus Aenigmarchaeota archaeon]
MVSPEYFPGIEKALQDGHVLQGTFNSDAHIRTVMIKPREGDDIVVYAEGSTLTRALHGASEAYIGSEPYRLTDFPRGNRNPENAVDNFIMEASGRFISMKVDGGISLEFLSQIANRPEAMVKPQPIFAIAYQKAVNTGVDASYDRVMCFEEPTHII